MQVELYTDVGGRELNEDSLLSAQDGDRRLFAVADGLGGHDCGEVASKMAITELERQFVAAVPFLPEKAIGDADLQIAAKQKEMGVKMRTTVAVAYVAGEDTAFTHVGDSRIYAFSNGKIVYQSPDHSASQMAVLAGEIPMSELRRHPDRNLLTRALGGAEGVKADTVTMPTDAYDALLLCSDGFWEYVTEDEMCKALCEADSPAAWLSEMRAIRDSRAPKDCDNNTAVAVMK